ncbi:MULTISPECIES: hypothetical protein [unclassified Marinobacter]|uniref:hypothetical protein n=1 Tax=unclassified Marinobacter TaxID=83889 RepID=UPI001267A3E3|nr:MULTISPECIES: hypothetical protein [unclassified Marinobacter]QFS87589.1 hypothetical protein FIV08_12220 [Marinobacter sp. THAF197a]QFT51374.1 hypothetical protein FIU96_12135 [Marinobacter sp. THAF39]
MLELRPYESGDEVELAPRLKEIDVYECYCASGLEPLAALQESIKDSLELVTLVLDGSVLGISGVTPLDGEWYGVWLLTDDRLPQCRKSFLKLSHIMTRQWVSKYTHLCNWVALANETSRLWLATIGFTESVIDTNFMGSGEPFVFIHRSYA